MQVFLDIFSFAILPLWAGLTAAAIHVLTGPDHLAAVTPLVFESKKKYWKVGFFWGLGHISGMLGIGVLLLLFKDLIPVEQISAHSEHLVGLLLILIGGWSFYRIFHKPKLHVHPHVHHGAHSYVHIHPHQHHVHTHQHTHPETNVKNDKAAFGIGVIHGFAGIAHFILLLPVLGFTNMSSSMAYIIGFGGGSVLAMSTYALLIGRANILAGVSDQQHAYKTLPFWGGVFAITVGIYWLTI
ncbi:MAG: hypothetical protein R2792_10165 [Saprospiraceae bacterium]